MDYEQKDKRNKSDKAKEKFERNGKYSAKAVRLAEAQAEKRKGSKPSNQ